MVINGKVHRPMYGNIAPDLTFHFEDIISDLRDDLYVYVVWGRNNVTNEPVEGYFWERGELWIREHPDEELPEWVQQVKPNVSWD